MADETKLIEGGVTKTNVPKGTYIFDGKDYYFFSMVTKEGFAGSSTTTDHYCENGTVIQDHIVDHPWTYTLTGVIAEKVHVYDGEPSAEAYVKRARAGEVLKKIQSVGQLAPTLSSYVYSAINAGRFVANRVTQLVKAVQGVFFSTVATDAVRSLYEKLPNSLTGIWGLTKDETKKIKGEATTPEGKAQKQYLVHREQAYWAKKFEEARLAHTLFELHCPYGVAQNMVIESVEFSQAKYWSNSDVTIRLKQVRFVGISESILSEEKTDSEVQKEEVKNLGTPQTTQNTEPVYLEDENGRYYTNDYGMKIYLK